ncbi:GNAT family N-acetyltransferase [Pseudooceanicola sp.]|jgi:RimJ/RimL family protein N-acetyltransferase|uniref:GNAT family N-acetyltransferase n=1 Tax=Pseudooceanicola sp. TaxID=1914328 RepID=UPI00405A34EA
MTRLPCETAPSGASARLARRVAAGIPELVTERLRLRAPLCEDFAIYAEIVLGPRGKHLGLATREEAWLDFAQMVAGWTLRGHGVWTVEPKDGGEAFGFVLLGFDQEDPEPELGYLFTGRAEGRGIASEAARAARDFAFAELGWKTLTSYVADGNARSAALAERLGGKLDGRLPDAGGDTLVYRYKGGEVRA